MENIDEGEIAFGAIGSGGVFLDTPFDVWRVFVPPAKRPASPVTLDSPLWIGDWAGACCGPPRFRAAMTSAPS